MMRVEVLKSRKSNSKFLMKFFFLLVFFIGFITFVYIKRDHLLIVYQSLLLSDDIKFIKENDKKINLLIFDYLKKGSSIPKKDIETLNKEIENINNLLKYLENHNSDLNPIYYYLAFNYFYQSILSMELTKEQILLQIQHGSYPNIKGDNIYLFMNLINELQKYSKKFLAIEDHKNDNIQLLNIFSDILYFRIISKKHYMDINQIDVNQLDQTLIPIYEWLMLIINSNHGDIEKIKGILENPHIFWQFSENETLLIYATTYYYQKDYYNLLKTFFEYKNKNLLTFENIHQFKEPSEIFIYKEFIRILMEVYYLQANYEYSKYYLFLLEKSLKTFPSDYDAFIKKRMETIKSKIY